MTAVDKALREFQGAWERAERPDLNACLRSVPEAERDELAQRVADWLETAPSPAYPDEVRAEMAAEPVLVAALEASALARMPMASRLPALRSQAGLALGDLAARVSSAFGLGDADRARTEEYLGSLEDGSLDESRLSGRLTARLADLLGVRPEVMNPLSPAPAALFRADDDLEVGVAAAEFDALAQAALSPAPTAEPLDEVDRLFRGGPEG